MTFRVGDRVEIDYGQGRVVELFPDASGRGRPDLVVVKAHGQAWFRDPSQVRSRGMTVRETILRCFFGWVAVFVLTLGFQFAATHQIAAGFVCAVVFAMAAFVALDDAIAGI